MAGASNRIAVYLEVGSKRVFACALDWPGWCRVARSRDEALQVLADYAPRYARVARRAKLSLPAVKDAAAFDVVETIAGNATTDFGAPNVVPLADLRAVDRRTAQRDVALLVAAWEELDAVAGSAPAALRKGPRGGGRDRDVVIAHVHDAERAYARKVGVALTAKEWQTGGVALLRARMRDALGVASGVPAAEARRWPPRYLTRRTAWHVLDHAWEIEDKS